MDNEYIINGEVARNKIAMDIKYRKLNRTDIEKLVADPKIKRAFIGDSYRDKKPKNAWNKAYLDLLSYAVIGESFNRDYLLYLNDVAEHVEKNKSNKKKSLIIGAVLVIIVIIAGVVWFLNTPTPNVPVDRAN